MSSYSFRDRQSRLYGYRSQPTSNRGSIHLTGLSTSTESYGSRGSSRVNLNADLDRQLKRLVERTEKFSNRVENYRNTSNYLTRGLGSNENLASSRYRREAGSNNYVGVVVGDYSSTEEEWRRFLDLGILLEKACELVRRGNRYPKPAWQYSPDSPSPQPYDVPYGTVLIPNPHSPRDREGKRIKDYQNAMMAKQQKQNNEPVIDKDKPTEKEEEIKPTTTTTTTATTPTTTAANPTTTATTTKTTTTTKIAATTIQIATTITKSAATTTTATTETLKAATNTSTATTTATKATTTTTPAT